MKAFPTAPDDTMATSRSDAAPRIVDAGRRLDLLGLVPSTAGNISERLDVGRIAITRSGGRKGLIGPEAVIEVDAGARAVVPGDRPSAETKLHCQIYAAFPGVNAVVHGHSVALTVLTRVLPGDIAFSGYEVLKAFGTDTHEATLVLPVFANDQDMARLAATIAPRLASCRMGYALCGHGLYAWGTDMDDALGRLEAVEFLLACALEERRLAR